jgi:imidazolonepropionase-like amidohydrolase
VLRFCIIILHLLVFAVVPTFAQSVSAPLIFRDVRLFDGVRVSQHRSVLIENGIIVRDGDQHLKAPGAEIVSGEGRTLLPGLIDAHVHIPRDAREALQQGMALGVTTQLDMYSSPDKLPVIKALEVADAPGLSDVRTAGMGATVPGGHPTTMGGGSNLTGVGS